MLITFLLGLSGSFGHCAGMCTGITALLSRRGVTQGWRLYVLHLGRITTYAFLGLAAGSLGLGTRQVMSGMSHTGHSPSHSDMASDNLSPEAQTIQGILAVLGALLAIYFALALLGFAPSPELLLKAITTRWGKTMRGVTLNSEADRPAHFFTTFGLGLLWGWLPCGLVIMALLTAVAGASPLTGALRMAAFGLGTLPVLLGIGWLTRHLSGLSSSWPRYASAALMLVFGFQMAMRGFAVWGWIGHLAIGEIMLWKPSLHPAPFAI